MMEICGLLKDKGRCQFTYDLDSLLDYTSNIYFVYLYEPLADINLKELNIPFRYPGMTIGGIFLEIKNNEYYIKDIRYNKDIFDNEERMNEICNKYIGMTLKEFLG